MMAARIGLVAALALAAIFATSCATRGEKPVEIPPAAVDFTPVSFISPIHVESGAYGNLFSSDSYAVWSNPEVAELKRAQAAELGETIDPKLDTLSQAFNENFLVFECHLVSVFQDTSIGYDAVGLRNADVYLATPDGQFVRPIQMIMAGPLRETAQQALRKFERVNLVVFPRKDLASGTLTVDSTMPAARLVIEAARTKFYFEWASPLASAPPAPPTMEDRLRAVKLGFTDCYRKLAAGAHIFD